MSTVLRKPITTYDKSCNDKQVMCLLLLHTTVLQCGYVRCTAVMYVHSCRGAGKATSNWVHPVICIIGSGPTSVTVCVSWITLHGSLDIKHLSATKPIHSCDSNCRRSKFTVYLSGPQRDTAFKSLVDIRYIYYSTHYSILLI